MALAEVLQLASLIKDIVSGKRELDKEYFEKYIQPSWDLFSIIHNDYKESLRKYANLVNTEGISADAVIEEIRRDLILTEDLRSELGKMFSNFRFRSFASKEEQDSISEYMEMMYRYFQSQKTVDVSKGKQAQTLELSYDGEVWDKDYVPMNRLRTSLIIYLSRKAKPPEISEELRQMTLHFFEGVAMDMQRKHGEVARTYYKLKKSVLAW